MPWLLEATKDVTSCDKLRGEANTHYNPQISEWGNPMEAIPLPARPERTRGTETSHYPEEKKTKVIAQVVASERAGAQTLDVAKHSRGL